MLHTQKLRKKILKLTTDDCRIDNRHAIVPNVRQQIALASGLRSAETARHGLEKNLPFELVAVDLEKTKQELDGILGLRIESDLLERIFSRFCIGK